MDFFPDNGFESRMVLLILQNDSTASCRLPLVGKRKVRATQSAIFPNGKLSVMAEQCDRKQPPSACCGW